MGSKRALPISAALLHLRIAKRISDGRNETSRNESADAEL
jgi:hypothetical protein